VILNGKYGLKQTLCLVWAKLFSFSGTKIQHCFEIRQLGIGLHLKNFNKQAEYESTKMWNSPVVPMYSLRLGKVIIGSFYLLQTKNGELIKY